MEINMIPTLQLAWEDLPNDIHAQPKLVQKGSQTHTISGTADIRMFAVHTKNKRTIRTMRAEVWVKEGFITTKKGEEIWVPAGVWFYKANKQGKMTAITEQEYARRNSTVAQNLANQAWATVGR